MERRREGWKKGRTTRDRRRRWGEGGGPQKHRALGRQREAEKAETPREATFCCSPPDRALTLVPLEPPRDVPIPTQAHTFLSLSPLALAPSHSDTTTSHASPLHPQPTVSASAVRVTPFLTVPGAGKTWLKPLSQAVAF